MGLRQNDPDCAAKERQTSGEIPSSQEPWGGYVAVFVMKIDTLWVFDPIFLPTLIFRCFFRALYYFESALLSFSNSSFIYYGTNSATLLVSAVVEGPDDLTTTSSTSAAAIISGYVFSLPWIGPVIGSFKSSGPALHPIVSKGRFDGLMTVCSQKGSVIQLHDWLFICATIHKF